MIRILANDGIHPAGLEKIKEAGIQIDTEHIPMDSLKEKLGDYDGILVRSATKVRKETIDANPRLKLICRGGVGMDNIDVDYARSQGLAVHNTPAASSNAVAELVFGHLLSAARFLHLSNREMAARGNGEFKTLKKSYSKGVELKDKTIGVLGFGRIGQRVGEIALAFGMKVLAYDIAFDDPAFDLSPTLESNIAKCVSPDEIFSGSDFISLHVPALGDAAVNSRTLALMKDGVGIVNCARGGVVDEEALLEALENNKVSFACLDVFENEPSPKQELLEHPRVSVSPHIGASTGEAQRNIGLELADHVISHFKG